MFENNSCCENMNLISAIESRSLLTVQYLLQTGADPNYPLTNLGMRPVHFAVKYQCPDILEELLNRGAIVDDPCSPMTTSILQMAIQDYPYQPEISLQMIKMLIQDQQIKNQDVLGQALQYACGMGYPPIVELLLHANTNPNYYPDDDEYAMTPLIGMIFENERCEGHVEILQMLLLAGVDLSHVSANMTALDYAVTYRRDDLIPLLQSPLTLH